jgi:hypothetical protein
MDVPVMQKAKRPEMTEEAVRKCFGKLGETRWSLSSLKVSDPDGLYVPASVLNAARREIVARLDSVEAAAKTEKIEAVKSALEEDASESVLTEKMRVVKVRLAQSVPPGDWGEVVVAIGHSADVPEYGENVRLALPVFTKEADGSRFRARVKSLIRSGYVKWEAADVAGIRMLKSLGIDDITADWTVYAFNSQSVLALRELGVRRCVLSPECASADMPRSCAIPAERLVQQSTPLFVSVTKPASKDPSRLVDAKGCEFASFETDGLWVTTRTVPRTFPAPPDAIERVDLSWDPEL